MNDEAGEAQRRGTPQMLPLDELIPGEQLREETPKPAQLAKSIERHGILQPLGVRPLEAGGYGIIWGNRRYFAAIEAGLEEVPCIIEDVDDDRALVHALTENVFRSELTPMEKGRALLRVFRLAGYDGDAEMITNVLQDYRLHNRSPPGGQVPHFEDILAELPTKPRTMESWLKTLGTTEEVQEAEEEAEPEAKLDSHVLEAIAGIEDEALQLKVHDKLKQEHPGRDVALRYIATVKDASPDTINELFERPVHELMVEPTPEPEPEPEEPKYEPEEEPPKVAGDLNDTLNMAERAVDVIAEAVKEEPPVEQAEAVTDRLKAISSKCQAVRSFLERQVDAAEGDERSEWYDEWFVDTPEQAELMEDIEERFKREQRIGQGTTSENTMWLLDHFMDRLRATGLINQQQLIISKVMQRIRNE